METLQQSESRAAHINLRMTERQLAQVDALAKRHNVTRSQVVRAMLDKALQEETPDTRNQF